MYKNSKKNNTLLHYFIYAIQDILVLQIDVMRRWFRPDSLSVRDSSLPSSQYSYCCVAFKKILFELTNPNIY